MFSKTRFALALFAVALAARPAAFSEVFHFTRDLPPAPTVAKTADGPGLQFAVGHFVPWHGFCWGTMTVTTHAIRFDSATQPDHSFNENREELLKLEDRGRTVGRGEVRLTFRDSGTQRFMLVARPRYVSTHSESLVAALEHFDAAAPQAGAAPSNPQIASTAPPPSMPAARPAASPNTPSADPRLAAQSAMSVSDRPIVQPQLTSFRATRPPGMERATSVAIFSAVLDAVHDPNQINGALYFLTDADGSGPDITRLLLARGADVNTTIFYNVTPLTMIVDRGCGAAFAHALVEEPRQAKRIPCSPTEVTHVVSLLLEHGARTDVRDSAGATPLMRAAETGNLDVVQVLVAHGADLSAKDNKGHSALEYAKDGRGIEMAATGRKLGKGNDAVIHFLENHGQKG